jgi:hypothetical protein
MSGMKNLKEIKDAIEQLPAREQEELVHWLDEQMDDAWDRQMQRDVEEGKLDALLNQVERHARDGQLREMP